MAGAGKGIRVSGIFVPVELDLTNLDKSLKDMNQSLGQVTTTLKNAFAGDVSPATLANKLVKVTEAFGKINQGASAITRLRPFDEMIKGSEEFSKALQNISKQSGFTTAQLSSLYERTAKQAGFDQQIQGLRTLQQQYKMTAQEAVAFAKMQGATLSPEAISQFMSTRATAERKQGRGLAGIFTPTSISAGAQSALAATGVVTGMYGITELVKSSYQASMKMDNLNLSFESIYGSSAKAGAQMDFVRKVSDELGLSFTDTAEGAKKLFAAARGTEVEKDANQIFKAFSTMGAALKLTGDETNSVFLAVSQMISKGKVSAEELRLQLAERMPGAVTLFAKSIGVTTKELDQMLQNGQVGLDSLRKFALEVQNTYAAGAAGASKGMQAELNRVSNAWFFLKQAFVDSKGTADLLSTVSSALKTITDYAPQISALASALLKVGLAATGVYAVAKAFAAMEASIASAGSLAGILKLRNAITGLANSPVAAAVGIGVLVGAAMSLVPAHEAAAAAIQNVTFDMDKYGEAAKNAADQVGRMNRETQANAVKRQQDALDVARARFTRFGETGAPELNVEGTGYTQRASAYAENLQAIKSLMGIPSTAQNRLLTEAQNLGAAYYEAFNTALEQNASQEQYDFLTKAYVEGFQHIKLDMEKQGVPPDVIKSFTDFTNKLLESGTAAQTAKQTLEDLQKGTADSALAMKEFNNAYDAVIKMTKDTDLGKNLAYQEQAKGVAEGLVKMAIVAEEAKNKLTELGARNIENAATWDTNAQTVKRFTDAMSLLGQDAIKNKSDLSILETAIASIAGKFTGATTALQMLQGALRQGFQIGGEGEAAKAIDKLKTEQILAGQSAGTRKAISELQPFLKKDGESSGSVFVSAFVSGSRERMKSALKDLNISEETANKLIDQARATAGATDAASAAKKAQSNWESVNSVIEQATKTLDTWRSKVDESKSDQFGATIVSEVEKIDKAIRSSKGNAEQLAQLRSLREEILRTGELRKQQIKEEQEREQSKEMTRYRTRVTAGFKKLEGVDNIETYAAAKGQYEDDVKFFQHALDEKRISQEDFNSYMMMLNKTLADAQLRSQTDMFSRLKVAANDYYKKYGDFTRHIGDVVTTAMDSSAKAIAAFARSGASDFASLASAFARMADQILTTATDLFAQQAVSALWKGLGDWVGSLSSPFGGAYSSGKVQEVPRGAIYGPSANGNVFSGGNLSAYSGSIVASPTYFSASSHVPAYATGAGLMGEAGPEGIFPLTRVNGKLGVRAEMGQSQPTILNQAVSVNINNASGAQVMTQQTKDNQGNISIDVMIEEAVGKSMRRPGSSPYKSLQSNFGARQQLASV